MGIPRQCSSNSSGSEILVFISSSHCRKSLGSLAGYHNLAGKEIWLILVKICYEQEFIHVLERMLQISEKLGFRNKVPLKLSKSLPVQKMRFEV